MIAAQNEIKEYQDHVKFWEIRSQQASQLVQESQTRLGDYRDRLIELRTDPKYKDVDRSHTVNKFRKENSVLGSLLIAEQYCRNKANYNKRVVDYLEFLGG